MIKKKKTIEEEKKKFKLKSGKTTVKYYPTVFDKKTGKIVWGKGHKLLRDAKKEELEMIERLNFYGKLETDKSNFGEVAKLWLDSTKSTYADKTCQKVSNIMVVKKQLIFQEICNITSENDRFPGERKSVICLCFMH